MPDNKSYKNQKLIYSSDGRLLDEFGNSVMMDWETPIMEKTAEIICRNKGRILNVGFGMGIIDTFIQSHNVSEHWIIEPHIDVYTKMLKDGWHLKPNVKILYGDWQGYLKYLPAFDGIFFDTWEDDMSDFIKLIPNFMNENSIFSFFNNPRDDSKGLHMIETQLEVISTWGDVEFESIELEFIDSKERQRTDDLIYWSENWKKYFCPIIKKKKKNKNMASLLETKLPSTEMVNGPAHYGGADNVYEVIKVCEAWDLDKDAYLFNVVKYVARAGKKNVDKEIEDLEKALFYLNRKIENLKK